MSNKHYLVFFALVIACCVFYGCEEKRKALVSAHTAMGELLISTRDQAKAFHTKKMIDDQTYQSIRTNWIRAQTSYLTASDILEHILDTNTQNITPYTELITQVSTILSDIALWLEEDKHEPTSDHSINNPIPTPNHEVSGGSTEGAGTERVGQGSTKANRAGDEGQGVGGDVGKLTFSSNYTASYNARHEIFIQGITDKTKEVRITVFAGSVVYTLDGSEPVLTEGVPYLATHQSIVLDADMARHFRAKSSMDGTQLSIMILGNN